MPAGKLTRRQKLFAAAVVAKGGNASAAAREVGVRREGASAQAAAWMALPHVAAEVARVTELRLARFEITTERVLQAVSFGAFVELPDIFNEDGEAITPPSEWPIEVRASVESIEVIERMREESFTTDKETGARVYVPAGMERRYKVKLVDKTAHRTLLMRYLHLLTEKVQHEHKHTLEHIIGASMQPRTIDATTVAAAVPLRLESPRSGTPIEAPQAGGSRAPTPVTLETSPRDVELFD